MTKGPLKITVMKLLSDHEMSGYSLMKAMEHDIGWRPSPGSIYPLLLDLRKKKFVAHKEKGRQKIYHLTLQGKKLLIALQNNRKAFLDEMQNHVSAFACIGEEKEVEDMKTILRIMREKQGHLSWLHEDAVAMRRAIFELSEKKVDKQSQDKVKKIIKKTTQELKRFL